MDKVALMKVEETFLIKGLGLILTPSFELPAKDQWIDINETVTVRTPDSRNVSAEALFSVVHLNMKDPPARASKRWQIVVCLKKVSKASIPVGSTVFVASSTKQAIKGPWPI